MLGAFVNKAMALEQAEAKALAGAVAEVAKHYPAMTNVLDPKIVAWWGLIQTGGLIYGPRALMIYRGSRAPGPAKPTPTHAAEMPGAGGFSMNGQATWPQQ